MSRLNASEREVVLHIADDESAWAVFTDSARLTRRILAVAARWGVTPECQGVGHQFTLPLAAVRFVGPHRLTDRRREASRRSIQKARFALRTAARIQAAALSSPLAGVETPAEGSEP